MTDPAAPEGPDAGPAWASWGVVRTLRSPRGWLRTARVARTVQESLSFLWREVNRVPVTSRYHLRGSPLVVHVRHDTPDIAGMAEVFVQGNYELPEAINSLLGPIARERPLRVVDLGGNIGLFALRVLRGFPDARLTCFEPDPANAGVLALTVAASPRPEQWQVVLACAGASTGVVPFLTGHFLESQILPEADARAELVPKVDIFPYLESADWLKIDIEGGEWEMMADPRFASLAIPVIWLEYHPQLCPSQSPGALVTETLTRAGYRILPFAERAPGLGELWAWCPSAGVVCPGASAGQGGCRAPPALPVRPD